MGNSVRRDKLLIAQAKVHTKSDSGSGAKFNEGFANLLFIGGAGDIALVLEDDSVVVIPAVLAGMWHSMPPFKRINNTNTAATGTFIVGITFT